MAKGKRMLLNMVNSASNNQIRFNLYPAPTDGSNESATSQIQFDPLSPAYLLIWYSRVTLISILRLKFTKK